MLKVEKSGLIPTENVADKSVVNYKLDRMLLKSNNCYKYNSIVGNKYVG
jgi:hypothetical protein